MTSNNTLFGTQWSDFPDTGSVPLVARHVLRLHVAQVRRLPSSGSSTPARRRTSGPCGIVVVLARKDLVEGGRKDIPKIFRYTTHAENHSLYNTPPTFSIYLVRNVLAWTEGAGRARGHREAATARRGACSTARSTQNADFYRAPVEKESRSLMNVVFRLPTEALEEQFVAEAKKAKMVGLKGHRSAGGIRVSTYNAVSLEAVQALDHFMRRLREGERSEGLYDPWHHAFSFPTRSARPVSPFSRTPRASRSSTSRASKKPSSPQPSPASTGSSSAPGSKVTAKVIEAAKGLKVIGRAGIGVDNVDVAAASTAASS